MNRGFVAEDPYVEARAAAGPSKATARPRQDKRRAYLSLCIDRYINHLPILIPAGFYINSYIILSSENLRLTNKIAILTDASKGICAFIAKHLAAASSIGFRQLCLQQRGG
jgi:hypothetical protein